jgi:hypothetical protein
VICSMSKTGFDYSQVNAKDLEIVQKHASEIKSRMGKLNPSDVFEIGQRLIDVKSRLPHGLFSKWISTEFDWAERTTRNMMQVAERFKTANFAEMPIATSAIYQLSSPSVPDEAIEEAIRRAEAGETITNAIAKEIVKEHKTSKPDPPFDAEKTLEKVKKSIDAIEETVPAECKEWFGEYLILLGKQIIGRAERVD